MSIFEVTGGFLGREAVAVAAPQQQQQQQKQIPSGKWQVASSEQRAASSE